MNTDKILLLLLAFLPVTTEVLSQTTEFNFSRRNYGWYCANNCEIEKDEQYLKINITGDYPYVMSPENLKVDASKYKRIKIKLLNHTGPVLDIFWTTNDEPYIRPQACQRSILSASATHGNKFSLTQNNFIEYTIDLSRHKEWKGIIRQLRIDPGDGPEPENLSEGKIIEKEYFLIEYLKFVP